MMRYKIHIYFVCFSITSTSVPFINQGMKQNTATRVTAQLSKTAI